MTALTAALALQEPFTVEDLQLLLFMVNGRNLIQSETDLVAKLRAYIEGRQAQSE